MRDRRRYEEDESVGGRLARAQRQPAGELRGSPAARQQAYEKRRDCDDAERERVRGYDAAERAGGPGAGETRQHRDPDRAGREDEHEEDAVGGEEAVRLDAAAELTRDHDADSGREAGDDGHRERGQQSA